MEESIENNIEKTARKPRKQTTHENKTVQSGLVNYTKNIVNYTKKTAMKPNK